MRNRNLLWSQPIGAMVAFAIETGLRREEQFFLRWDCIDFENAVLTVPLPNGGNTRHVPLTAGAIASSEPIRAF